MLLSVLLSVLGSVAAALPPLAKFSPHSEETSLHDGRSPTVAPSLCL